MDMQAASPSDLNGRLARLRAAHQRQTPDYAQRIGDLKRLRAGFKARLDDFVAAMSADFGRRSRHESLLSDGMTVLNEIDHLLRHLRGWMRPKKAAADWLFAPARTEIRFQPLGVVGIISPWNYPLYLSLNPLAVAIAAGNHVMLKPSEHTPRTSELLKQLLNDVFPDDRVATVLGGPDVAAAFAALPFDHLFFTGSTAVGRKIMAAAAQNLTPVTLELGGKSPAIIAPDFPVETAAERIAAGKFLNAGQTCIAPDYVLLPRAAVAPFVAAVKKYISQRYADLPTNPDYTSIVNAGQYARLKSYLDQAHAAGAQIIELAAGDAGKRVMPPTLARGPGPDAGRNLRPDPAARRRRFGGRGNRLHQRAAAAARAVSLRQRQGAHRARARAHDRRRRHRQRCRAAHRAERLAVRRRRPVRHGPIPRPRRFPDFHQAETGALPGALQQFRADASAVPRLRRPPAQIPNALISHQSQPGGCPCFELAANCRLPPPCC
jgi:coniferyl-aldehyde dehydrogenase